jgi:predicted DNA-binding antitoxin AbrB/MazE fold protein
MTIKAIYENGVFRPKEPVELADHTEVEVVLPSPASANEADSTESGPFDDIIGIIKDAPKDMAQNHNFYLYGYARSDSEP